MGEAFGALGINVPGLIAQIINFSLLLALLYFVLYKPILRRLDERSARIQESLEQAELIQQKAEQADQEFQRRLEEGRREAQALVAQAEQAGQRLKEGARQGARQEAEALIERARSQIQLERDEAISELRKQFADLTILAAERVINASLDEEAHRRLVQEVLEEASSLKQG